MQSTMCLWEVPPQSPHLLPQEIHVWRARLDIAAAVADRFRETLSSDERQRAARFVYESHRRRFIVSRGRLRVLLAGYCNRMPHEIQFRYGPQGKPALAVGWDRSGIRFNLSHSDDWALYAFSKDREVGIDVERVRKLHDIEALADRYFAPPEQTELQGLPAEQRLIGFFNIWTRKEALLKAVGSGLSLPPNQVVVSLSADVLASVDESTSTCEPVEWSSVTLGSATAEQWSLCSFVPARGYAAALATVGNRPRVFQWFCTGNSCGEATGSSYSRWQTGSFG